MYLAKNKAQEVSTMSDLYLFSQDTPQKYKTNKVQTMQQREKY